MASLRRLTARALARALLGGVPTEAAFALRMRGCLEADAPWIGALAARCALLPMDRWARLDARRLATYVEHDTGYQQAWAVPEPERRPRLRSYLLRPHRGLVPPPAALGLPALPDWHDLPALAQALGISEGGLWRLTKPSDWQRRSPLGEQHYAYQLLAKPTGGWRLLEVPNPYLMPLQRQLLERLLDAVPPHEAACGYRRGRSVVDHARVHAGQAVVLRFDLQDFFTAIRAQRVHALFATLVYPWPVASTLTGLCTTATPEPVLRRLHAEGGLSWPQLQRLRDPHLPQGAPTSAALSNLCAFRLDLRLAGLAEALQARYTRYADDIVLSGGEALARARTRIEAWVGHIALDEGFRLNHRKTRCLAASRRQSVCGVVVNARPNLPRPEFDRLKAILHRCVVDGPASQNRQAHPQWREHLIGRVAWAQQLNPRKAARLRRLLEQIDWAR